MSSKIVLDLVATFCQSWPRIEVDIDNKNSKQYLLDRPFNKITLRVSDDPGSHALNIKLIGKTHDHTKVEHGQITQDQTVTLRNIYVNDVDLPQLFLYQGTYNDGQSERQQCLTWGINDSVWTWAFDTPIIDWAIWCKNENDNQYKSAEQSWQMQSQKILETLAELEKRVNAIDF